MELEWLETFKEAAARGSLTATAEALGYSQPAVSRQISALEMAVGARLFDRLPRGVQPTEEGRCLLTHAEAILSRMRTARQALDALRNLDAGRLRAGAIDSAAAALVPQALAAFQAAHPGVTRSVVEGNTPVLLDRLENGEIDIAIVSSYPTPMTPASHVSLHHLLDDPLMVALPAGHHLAWPGPKELRLADLADESWIEGLPHCYQTLEDACLRRGFRPRIDFVVREWIAKLGFIAAGLGVALVPLLAARAVRPDVVLRSLHPDDTLVRHVYAATWRTRATPAAVTAFVHCLDDVAHDLRAAASGSDHHNEGSAPAAATTRTGGVTPLLAGAAHRAAPSARPGGRESQPRSATSTRR
jgi:DNA-binding transcriptional LysR family regulator